MAQLTVRIDDELKDQFDKLARHEGKTTSDVVRDLVNEYVQDRDRSAFLRNLWNRMRENAEAAGMTREDVDETIARIRSEDR
jgi:predicted DNA-binding protein